MKPNNKELTRTFLGESWREARDGLLARTQVIRILPQPSATPACFRFVIDRPFKRKTGPIAAVELVDGPIFGAIVYAPDQFAEQGQGSAIAVFMDPDLSFFHPNACRRTGAVCLGDLPQRFPLEDLLQHLFSLVSYQERTPRDPLDAEAARYFALDTDAMTGLEPVEPLY